MRRWAIFLRGYSNWVCRVPLPYTPLHTPTHPHTPLHTPTHPHTHTPTFNEAVDMFLACRWKVFPGRTWCEVFFAFLNRVFIVICGFVLPGNRCLKRKYASMTWEQELLKTEQPAMVMLITQDQSGLTLRTWVRKIFCSYLNVWYDLWWKEDVC